MYILIDVNHPAHVHVFRNAAHIWQERGDHVLFTATDRDVIVRLLEAYNLPYRVLNIRKPGKLNMARQLITRSLKLIQLDFKPDVMLSVGSPMAAFASTVRRVPHITFDDTEDSVGQAALYRPFTKIICVPECFGHDFGSKMVRYAGYHELMYLHPNRFTPDAARLQTVSAPFFVVRFISWDAAHDDNATGLTQAGKRKLLELLLNHGQVVLSLEKKPPVLLTEMPADIETGGILLPPDNMHHYLAFADMYIGEGVTAASEAAVLGTPSILINTREMGYIKEQEEKYSLCYRFDDEAAALEKISGMLNQPDLEQVWRLRRERMLADKIDVTAWLIQLVDRTL
jgi:predicted glycosyltransferase